MRRKTPVPPAVRALFALALAVPATVSAAEDLVIGKHAVWARSVGGRTPGPGHTGSAPHAPLYFWMTYEGSGAALRHLREQGAFPIRHRWSVAVGDEFDIEVPDEAFTERLSVPLAVGSDSPAVVGRLANEAAVTPRGTFSWRTWSRKGSVSRGVWRVEVLYDDDTPVRCEAGGALRPCIFRIRVK